MTPADGVASAAATTARPPFKPLPMKGPDVTVGCYTASGSSRRIGRFVIMTEPPSIDAGEITDKGYVNQRATLERRDALVKGLYANPPAEGVISLQETPHAGP
jgi:hypothetical protein